MNRVLILGFVVSPLSSGRPSFYRPMRGLVIDGFSQKESLRCKMKQFSLGKHLPMCRYSFLITLLSCLFKTVGEACRQRESERHHYSACPPLPAPTLGLCSLSSILPFVVLHASQGIGGLRFRVTRCLDFLASSLQAILSATIYFHAAFSSGVAFFPCPNRFMDSNKRLAGDRSLIMRSLRQHLIESRYGYP